MNRRQILIKRRSAFTTSTKSTSNFSKIPRFKKRKIIYKQNVLFTVNAKPFYRDVEKEKITVEDTAAIEVEILWENSWSNEKTYDKMTCLDAQKHLTKLEQAWKYITIVDLRMTHTK